MIKGENVKKVYYVGAYDTLENGRQLRKYSVAAARKMDYICDLLTEMGYEIEIVSPAFSIETTGSKVDLKVKKINEKTTLVLAPCWKSKNSLQRKFNVIYVTLWLFNYLMKHCGKDDTVLLYHQIDCVLPVLLSRFFKRFKLILEVEEKYGMVWPLKKRQKVQEEMMLNAKNKKTMVVSEVLAEELGMNDAVISYGSYNVYNGKVPQKFGNDSKTLVFTGMVEKVRGGAFMAVEVMRHLPADYTLEISGPVSEKDKSEFEALIDEVNAQCGRKAVVYHGLLNDNEYQELLLRADIALNPQKDGGYGAFLFPSKILTYLSYGLPVVSTKGLSIVKSKVAPVIAFAESYEPKDIAKTIKNTVYHEPEFYINAVKKLNEELKADMAGLLEN